MLNLASAYADGPLEKELSDYKDVQLYGKLFFGSELEPHKVIFDTGSSWLWV
jgi:hypothetical protein